MLQPNGKLVLIASQDACTACAVIETARKHKNRIGKLYAGRNGILGALDEDELRVLLVVPDDRRGVVAADAHPTFLLLRGGHAPRRVDERRPSRR